MTDLDADGLRKRVTELETALSDLLQYVDDMVAGDGQPDDPAQTQARILLNRPGRHLVPRGPMGENPFEIVVMKQPPDREYMRETFRRFTEPFDRVVEASLHPHGRCTCFGEGQCEWCRREPTP